MNCANQNVYFWRLFEAAFQSRLLIGLRRLFDDGRDTFSIHKFLNHCRERISAFSKQALRSRRSSHPDSNEWIDDFINDAYEPTLEDFNKFRKLIRDNCSRIKRVYTPAVSKIYAHAIHTDNDTISSMLSDLNFDEMENALNAVWHVYNQVWQIYENGKKPDFRMQPYPYADEVNQAVLRQLRALA